MIAHSDAFRGPLYRMILSLPCRSRMAGKDTTPYRAQRSVSTVQSTLRRCWLVSEVAASHSDSNALLPSLIGLLVCLVATTFEDTYVLGFSQKQKISQLNRTDDGKILHRRLVETLA